MGLSSKPLTIHISHDLYASHQLKWDTLREQGFDIQVCGEQVIDLYLAPYAMRLTVDMLTQLPAALDLAIKGARALRYAPHGVTIKKGSPSAKGTKALTKRKSTKQAQAIAGGEPPVESLRPLTPGTTQGVGDTAAVPISNTTHDEGAIAPLIERVT